MASARTVRIGNGCGFWGDNVDAPVRLASAVQLDYLTLEYLAELTMSILALQKQRDPSAGYATDFPRVLYRLATHLAQVPGGMDRFPRVITNAGGMNPRGCAEKAREALRQAGVSRRFGIVSGDDLMPRLDALLAGGHPLTNLDTGEPLEKVRGQIVSANAYLGAGPIVEALRQGADVVVTGRVADASLTVGPAVHELGWSWTDWDRLAAATVAGHLIECGAQVTGGLWCNWREVTDWVNIGYPYVDLAGDGSFEIASSNPAACGVNRETLSEQLLYEVGDPARYLTPDVVADFTSIAVADTGQRSMHVHGARGLPATDSYKVSIAYRAGYTASGTLLIAGPDAAAKAQQCGAALLGRLNYRFERSNVECLGAGACAPGIRHSDPTEVVLRVAVHDPRKDMVERFTKEFAPLVTSGPPGITGYTTGRPSVREVFAFWPALVNKSAVQAEVRVYP
jgi:Acyclic terpene utilisation family protein AtuA